MSIDYAIRTVLIVRSVTNHYALNLYRVSVHYSRLESAFILYTMLNPTSEDAPLLLWLANRCPAEWIRVREPAMYVCGICGQKGCVTDRVSRQISPFIGNATTTTTNTAGS